MTGMQNTMTGMQNTMTDVQNTMTGMQNARPFSAKPSGAIQPLQKPVLSQN